MPVAPRTHRQRMRDDGLIAQVPDHRPSAARRGYNALWRKVRGRVLKSRPLCVVCGANGRTVPATEVHHIRALSDGGTNGAGNLQGLCKACHSRKTARRRRC